MPSLIFLAEIDQQCPPRVQGGPCKRAPSLFSTWNDESGRGHQSSIQDHNVQQQRRKILYGRKCHNGARRLRRCGVTCKCESTRKKAQLRL